MRISPNGEEARACVSSTGNVGIFWNYVVPLDCGII